MPDVLEDAGEEMEMQVINWRQATESFDEWASGWPQGRGSASAKRRLQNCAAAMR